MGKVEIMPADLALWDRVQELRVIRDTLIAELDRMRRGLQDLRDDVEPSVRARIDAILRGDNG